jgi:hypothetical protein
VDQPLKWVQKKYKILIIKMATNNGFMKTTKANFVNLCDVETILCLLRVLLMLVSWAQKLQIHMFKKKGLSLNSKHETKEPR